MELFEQCCGSCRCLAEVSMTVRGAFRVPLGLWPRNATFVALREAAAVWPGMSCWRGYEADFDAQTDKPMRCDAH